MNGLDDRLEKSSSILFTSSVPVFRRSEALWYARVSTLNWGRQLNGRSIRQHKGGSMVRLASYAAITAATFFFVANGALAHGVTVQVGHNRISPTEITVSVGQVVHFENLDEMPGGHTLVADDGSFKSPGLAKGEGWHYTFTKPGTYAYHIQEHPKAVGKVIVVDEEPSLPLKP
jgi:plastocyanin